MQNIKIIKRLQNNDLIMETLDAVLPNAKLYIMNDEGGTMKVFTTSTIRFSKQTDSTIGNKILKKGAEIMAENQNPFSEFRSKV